jgi:carnitine-CoA ligase
MNKEAFYADVRARTVPNLLAFAAEAHGERPFLRESGEKSWLSFSGAYRSAAAIAIGFGRLGVKENDCVPFMLPNGKEFVLAWFGVALCRAAYVAINTSLVGTLLAAQLGLACAKIWVVHADYLELLEALPESLRSTVEVLVIVGSPSRPPRGWNKVIGFDTLVGTEADGAISRPAAKSHFLDVSSVGFTSGTTGPSKGVMSGQAQGVSNALTFVRLVDLTADDVIYTPLPMFHGMSPRMGVLPSLLIGCPIVIGKRFSGTRFWNEAIEAGATVAQAIFSIPNVLLAQPPGSQDTAHRVTRMFNAHHNEAFTRRFGATLVEALGISEVGLFIASPLAEQRPGSAGRAHPDWDVAVVDEDGMPAADGAAGEIVCRPRLPGLMMRGYLNQPERTVEATRDLWYHTGDIGRRDADGYFWFVDRAKERIRRRGENISSSEIENCVRGHARVADVAALAHPAREGEDDIRLVVVPRDGSRISEPDLHRWLSEQLPRFMLPRFIEVVPSLPYTATNKIEKTRLMADGLARHAWDAQVQSAAERTAERDALKVQQQNTEETP